MITYLGNTETPISAINLINTIGLTVGTDYNSSTGWFKYDCDGKTVFLATKVLRTVISWNTLNGLDLVFGKVITIGGKKYKCRIPTYQEWNDLVVHFFTDNSPNWENIYTICQDTYEDTDDIYLTGYSVIDNYSVTSKSNISASYGWRPLLEEVTGESVDENIKYLGLNNTLITFSDFKTLTGTTDYGIDVFDNTYRINWLTFKVNDKILYIADRVLKRKISRKQLDELDLIFGKSITIGTKSYTCRVLTGGNTDDYGSTHTNPNEWDDLIVPYCSDIDLFQHTYCTICQDKYEDSMEGYEDRYTCRGTKSDIGMILPLKYSGVNNDYGWRPILEKPLEEGDSTDAEFLGQITKFLTTGGLYSAIGDSIFENIAVNCFSGDITWYKFRYQGKTLLISNKCLKNNISWDKLNEYGLVFGKKITIGNETYKCRLITSAEYNHAPDVGNGEWDNLVVPFYSASFDHSTYYTICQENNGVGDTYVFLRGNNGVDFATTTPTSSVNTTNGWRPVLELIDENNPDLPPQPSEGVKYLGIFNKIVDTTTLLNKFNIECNLYSGDINWLTFNDNGRKIYIADRCIKDNISWNTLREKGLVEGTILEIDGKGYKIRCLTGASMYDGNYDIETEWDRYIVRGCWDNNISHWKNIYTICQEKGTEYGTNVTRGGKYVEGGTETSSGGTLYGWRPILELMYDKKDTKYLGVVSDIITANELDALGDFTNHGTLNYSGFINWLKFQYKGKTLYVADRCIIKETAWMYLDNFDHIHGRVFRQGKKKYLLRCLTGGDGTSTDNEWDELIVANNFSDDLIHYSEFRTICQEKDSSDSTNCVVRGGSTINGYATDGLSTKVNNGFRPVLEEIDDTVLSSKYLGKVNNIITVEDLNTQTELIYTPSGVNNFIGDITWLKFRTGNKILYVANRCVVKYIRWSELDDNGVALGRAIIINGKKYIIRLLTGAIENGSRLPGGEWNELIVKNNFPLSLFRWDEFPIWCQEDVDLEHYRMVRGGDTIESVHLENKVDTDIGWIPVLEEYDLVSNDNGEIIIEETLDELSATATLLQTLDYVKKLDSLIDIQCNKIVDFLISNGISIKDNEKTLSKLIEKIIDIFGR